MNASTPSVSVIVPVRNGGEQLEVLLGALARQTLPRERFEVIVVDDRSTDDTPGRVRRSGFARLVVAPIRGGSYAARNLGIVEARGEILAFTDGDCVPAPDWLERGLVAASNGVDLVAGHIDMPLGERPSASALVDYARHLNQERAVSEGFGATANLWTRRDVIERVGRFNDKLISGGDTEFGHRALARGAVIRYAPEVVVTHPARSHPCELARKGYRLGFGAAQQRHHAESGVLRARKRIWARPGAYKPSLRVYGTERLEANGLRLSPLQRVQMPLVEYFFVRLPIAAGNFSGALREAKARRAVGES
jgi:glycosyltransferase involved in cell wall biosynthesis